MPLRLKILAVVFVVLLGLVLFQNLFIPEQHQQASREVAIADTSAVFSVRFVKPAGEEIIIRRENGSWVLNDTYEARNYLKNLLLTGFAGMKVKREVSESARKETIEQMLNAGYKITVNGGRGTEGYVFYLAPNPGDPNSTLYYNSDLDTTPYIVQVPGFEGSISNLFALPASEWREKEFFVSSPENLQSVKVDYPAFPQQSFSISYGKSGFSVAGVESLDTLRLARYLNAFKYLTVNTYIEGGRDSLAKITGQSSPLAVVEMENLRQKRVLEIYEKNGKLWGIIPEQNQLVGLRPEVYNPLMVKREYFIVTAK